MSSLSFSFIATALLWAASPHGALARVDDPELARVEAARSEFDKAVEAANKKLLDIVESRVKNAMAKGDLKELETLNAIKSQVEKDGAIPDGTKDKNIVDAGRQRDRSVSVAASKVLSAYDQAIRDATKASKVELAKILAKEKESFEAQHGENSDAKALVGVWQVRISDGFRADWTFAADGGITSTRGAPKGTWKVEKDKKRVLINWDTGEWSAINLPINPAGSTGHEQDPKRKTTLKKK